MTTIGDDDNFLFAGATFFQDSTSSFKDPVAFLELQLHQFRRQLQPGSSLAPLFRELDFLFFGVCWPTDSVDLGGRYLYRLAFYFARRLHISFFLGLAVRQPETAYYGYYILINISAFLDDFAELHDLPSKFLP